MAAPRADLPAARAGLPWLRAQAARASHHQAHTSDTTTPALRWTMVGDGVLSLHDGWRGTRGTVTPGHCSEDSGETTAEHGSGTGSCIDSGPSYDCQKRHTKW